MLHLSGSSGIAPHEGWTHDHCWFCFACICDHRERFPEWKQAQDERGCYRHAYYSEREKGKVHTIRGSPRPAKTEVYGSEVYGSYHPPKQPKFENPL
jgi:hypothetical protein